MEFFDDALQKAKEALDYAYKKTGEAVNIQKSRFDAASLESKRSKDFEALGEIYFEQVKNAAENDSRVAELVASIQEKSEKIEALKEEIRVKKNVRICPSCGAQVGKNSAFCSRCGAQLIFEQETASAAEEPAGEETAEHEQQ